MCFSQRCFVYTLPVFLLDPLWVAPWNCITAFSGTPEDMTFSFRSAFLTPSPPEAFPAERYQELHSKRNRTFPGKYNLKKCCTETCGEFLIKKDLARRTGKTIKRDPSDTPAYRECWSNISRKTILHRSNVVRLNENCARNGLRLSLYLMKTELLNRGFHIWVDAILWLGKGANHRLGVVRMPLEQIESFDIFLFWVLPF